MKIHSLRRIMRVFALNFQREKCKGKGETKEYKLLLNNPYFINIYYVQIVQFVQICYNGVRRDDNAG